MQILDTMLKKVFTLFIFCFAILTNLPADNGETLYRPGEIMIQLNPRTEMSSSAILQKLQTDFAYVNLKPERKLSERMKIWLFQFDEKKNDHASTLSAVRQHKLVNLAQLNHYVSLRETTPDDPGFSQQWALQNTGQNGGTPDADIDATDAWDVNTGGITAFGDTLVIAVVDGGFDLYHEDLNFFKNTNEIPGNGIDDDENGYIDDYDGWNAYNHNGNITSNNHGTHVSGICAAIGNNETGISGVNWDAKVMAVQGSSGTESVVVEAYGYVLEMRATYNETGGEKGSFVVATNSSFGVDAGQPEDYPIWCALYDSLGMEGIISAAATANRNWDIDQVGDVPTACGSDYLVSVTNTTRYDAKTTNAGYGLETIDLGAPGSSIYSTYNGSNYGNLSGTSMATPQVAGAIAYLLSSADDNFLLNYETYPAEYALKIKQYIMEGVDILPSLEDVTVSGGRLNLNSSLDILKDPPNLLLSANIIDITVLENTTDSALLELMNTGGFALDYILGVNFQPAWISFSQTEGILEQGEIDTVMVYFDATDLLAGNYSCKIDIVHNYYNYDSVTVALNVSTGVGREESPANLTSLKAYPNPFNENITIDFDEKNIRNLEVIDLTGRTIKAFTPAESVSGPLIWNGRTDDGREAADGIYFLRLQGKQNEEIIKLIKR